MEEPINWVACTMKNAFMRYAFKVKLRSVLQWNSVLHCSICSVTGFAFGKRAYGSLAVKHFLGKDAGSIPSHDADFWMRSA